MRHGTSVSGFVILISRERSLLAPYPLYTLLVRTYARTVALVLLVNKLCAHARTVALVLLVNKLCATCTSLYTGTCHLVVISGLCRLIQVAGYTGESQSNHKSDSV